MGALNIPKAHLIGYSLGTGVELYCAVNHLQSVATLTTIGHCGSADPDGADKFEPECCWHSTLPPDVVTTLTRLGEIPRM